MLVLVLLFAVFLVGCVLAPHADRASNVRRDLVKGRASENAPARPPQTTDRPKPVFVPWQPGSKELGDHIAPQVDPRDAVVIPAEQVVPFARLKRRASRAGCPALLGLEPSQFGEFLSTVTFYRLDVVTVDQDSGGRMRALFGLASVKYKVITLFEPLWLPRGARAMTPLGVRRRPVLPYVEHVQNLRPGLLTPMLLREVIVIHELAHLLRRIPDDDTLEQSMRNTQRVIHSCFPELLANGAV